MATCSEFEDSFYLCKSDSEDDSDFEEYKRNLDIVFDSDEDDDKRREADERIRLFLKSPPPTAQQINDTVEQPGLCIKTIISHAKKGKQFKLLLPDIRDRNSINEEKFQKDVARVTLNMFIENYNEKLLQILTSDLGKTMEKIQKDFEGRDCLAAEDYFSWVKICFNIKFFENSEAGLEMFKRFSSLSKKYKEEECEKLFNDVNPTFGSIGIIISTVYKKQRKTDPKKVLDRKNYLKK